MNHDVLSSMLHSTMMALYKTLYDEYKNEKVAKRKAFNIAKDILVEFGMKGDLYKTYELFIEKYKGCTEEQDRLELYRKIEVLQNAIAIIKEANQVDE